MTWMRRHLTLFGLLLAVLLVATLVALGRPAEGGSLPLRVTDLPRSGSDDAPAALAGANAEQAVDSKPAKSSNSSPASKSSAPELPTYEGRSDPTKFGTGSLLHRSEVEAELVDVGTSTADGVESVTFDFANGTKLPRYKLSYTDAVRLYPDEDPIPMMGDAYLTVRFDRTDPNQSNRLAFPPSVQVGQPRVAEILLYDNLSESLRFAIGLNGRAPYRVRTLDDPLRMVVDFRTP